MNSSPVHDVLPSSIVEEGKEEREQVHLELNGVRLASVRIINIKQFALIYNLPFPFSNFFLSSSSSFILQLPFHLSSPSIILIYINQLQCYLTLLPVWLLNSRSPA